MVRTWALITILVVASACSSRARKPPRKGFEYPVAKTVEVVDDFHGTSVKDPYRWMEDADSEDLRAWIEAENKLTQGWLSKGSDRRKIRNRLEKLWNYEKFGVPKVEGGRYFYRSNSGLQNQAPLYVADSLDAEPRLLLDPNTLSEDGTVALNRRLWFSPDGRHMGYSVSKAGSDWKEFFVRDVETGEDLPADHLKWIKAGSGSWNAEGSGFYYTRLQQPQEGAELTALNKNPRVFYHSLGTSQDEDVLVYERPDEPSWSLYPWVTEDGRYLFIAVYKVGSKNNALFYKDLQADGEVKPLLADFDASYSILGNDGPLLYAYTNRDAPKGRVVSFDVGEPAMDKWKEIIPEGKNVLEDLSLIGDRFLVTRLRLARSEVTVYRLDGTEERKVKLPALGTTWGFNGRRKDTETFFGFSSFTYPATIYRFDIASGETSVFRRPKVDFKPENFFTRQVSYSSKDGTPVTMFISHRKGLVLNKNNPTLLYGYGGFDNAMTPYFSVSNLVWMEMGGVYAVANLRGGGEYGKEWHEAGMLKRKQNVFDDFIAAGESLCINRYTNPDKLAIEGWSNGGLLVGACVNQRPDLFAAALAGTGVMDMLRYHRFTAGKYWVSEYGSAEDPEMFDALFAYSPYHRIFRRAYPAVLVSTADHDDRVVPAHSFKYTARLQAAQKGRAPILIRIETKAGHGAGMPTSKRIDGVADRWTFLARNLRMKVKFKG
ncbi:MAG: prolyl oligopeptidase family serine peptidase [Planctomycetota bacterium]|jgi:prolyl oligopeptidase